MSSGRLVRAGSRGALDALIALAVALVERRLRKALARRRAV
ncbi:MAG TPA: hypothetical protein VFA42_08050 [Gaiellaceae bacterium]|nr:hypothetical protein [Gaiellaceae bacterium]